MVFSAVAWVALLFALSPVTGEGTVLVRDDAEVGTVGQGQTVLGWRRVPIGDVRPGDVTVANVYLDLLGHDPATEPFGAEQWALTTIDLAGAWKHTMGNPDVVIAIVDSGIEVTHPEFEGRLFTNPGEIAGNGVDDDGNGLVDDVAGWDVVDDDNDPTDPSIGHGTEVAGVAAASFNSLGIAGVTPTATILPVRACSTRCELFDVAWSIVYAVDMGADIINLSLGGFADPGPLADAVQYAGTAGVLVVAAAGNSGTDIDGASFVPAGLPNPNLVTVAATTRDDGLWIDSNYGAVSVDVGAPGAEIVTTTLTSLGEYRTVSGTSFAAPYASGVAALMLSANPDLAPTDLITHLGRYGTSVPALSRTTAFGTLIHAPEAVVAARLVDIHQTAFAEDIVWLAAAGITKGCNPPANNLYCPDRALTRAEMAAFLQRALDLAPGPDVFDDDNDSIFQPAINALAAAGITKGCNPPANNLYCPDRALTRAEMAAFLHRALD